MSEIPDEAVNAATGVYGGPTGRMRAALAAALPHLRVQETPDGVVIEHSAEEQWYCPTAGSIECHHAGFDVCCDAPEKHVALSFELVEKAVVAYHATPQPRPVVDREALDQLLEDHGVGVRKFRTSTEVDTHRAQIARAVLALLPTEEAPTPGMILSAASIAANARNARGES